MRSARWCWCCGCLIQDCAEHEREGGVGAGFAAGLRSNIIPAFCSVIVLVDTRQVLASLLLQVWSQEALLLLRKEHFLHAFLPDERIGLASPVADFRATTLESISSSIHHYSLP